MKNKKNLAFTLLEMLIVVGIISLLMGVGVVSFSTAQKKARDAKKRADLKAIQNALEEYYSICGYKYPTSLGTEIVCSTPSAEIMKTVPTNPKTGKVYSNDPDETTVTMNENSYTICVNLETSDQQFCVRNKQ